MSAILLSGCSKVPDAVNPVAWYRGATELFSDTPPSEAAREAGSREVSGDFPSVNEVPQRPKVLSPEERKDVAEGLVADRARAKYTDEKLNREGTPTRPLPPRSEAPKPAAPTHAAAPAAPEKPRAAVQPAPKPQEPAMPPAVAAAPPPAAPTPAPSPVPAAAETHPAPAPAPAPAAPPPPPAAPALAAPVASAAAPAPAPAPAAPVVAAPPASVEEAYRRRLTESARQTVAPPLVTPVAMATASAPAPAPSPASYLPTRIRFSGRGAALSAEDVALLQEVARQQRLHNASVSVVGYAGGAARQLDPVKRMVEELDIAVQRANAVARELVRLGVPAGVISVRTADVPTASGDTEVSIER